MIRLRRSLILTVCWLNATRLVGQETAVDASGGFSLALYGEKDRVTANLRYESARKPADSKIAQLTDLTLELLAPDTELDTIQWRLSSEECAFDFDRDIARSSAPTALASADGETSVTGVGFEWSKDTASIHLPQHQQSILALPENDSTLSVRAQRFTFHTASGLAVYEGGVTVHYGVDGDQMSTDRLELQLDPESSRATEGRALGAVVLQSAPGESGLRVAGKEALFDLSVAGEETVEFPQGLRWETNERRGQANFGRGSHRDQTVALEGDAALSVPFQNGRAKVEANAYTLRTDQIQFEGAAQLTAPNLILSGRRITATTTASGQVSNLEATAATLTLDTSSQGAPTTLTGATLAASLGDDGVDALTVNGEATWTRGELSGHADRLNLAPASQTMRAEGNAEARYRDPTRAELPPMRIWADQYRIGPTAASFSGHARMRFREWTWNAARIELAPKGAWEGVRMAHGGPDSHIEKAALPSETTGALMLDSARAEMRFEGPELEPSHVVADGQVRFESANRVATGERATYSLTDETVRMSGSPEVRESDGKRFIGGADSEVHYDLKNGAIRWNGPSRFFIPRNALRTPEATSENR